MADGKKFKTEVLWDQKHKLCKMSVTKNGNLIGGFNDMFKITVEKYKNKETNEVTYTAYLAPVKYTKVDLPDPPAPDPNDYKGGVDDDVPF